MRKFAALLVLFCAAAFAQQGSFTDERDGKNYKTTKIGKQTWMAENLNYEAEGSKCFDNDPANCEKYGRLYDWGVAMKACPNGWHLPTNKEWDRLYRFVDGSSGSSSPYISETAGKYLKAALGWNDYEGKSGSGIDKYDFAALPGGFGISRGYFYSVGYYGIWWTATEYFASLAYYRLMYFDHEDAYWVNYDKSLLLSVRCMQD